MAESASKTLVPAETVNTQRCWVVPAKYSFKWTVQNMYTLKADKIVSQILKGPVDTTFQLELELFQDSIFVNMLCTSRRAPFNVKGEIKVRNSENETTVQTDYRPFKAAFKKGKKSQTISPSYPTINQGSDLFLHCEFIAFSGFTKHQKLARSERENFHEKNLRETRKFGMFLEDYRKESFLTDTFLLVNAEKFAVHRLILAARCPKLLTCVEKTDTILNLYKKEVVNGLLEYVYTGNPHKLLEDKSRSLQVLKSISELGIKLEVPAVEYLFEIRNFETTTRCHCCETVFEWVIKGREILKLGTNQRIESSSFEFCSASCHLSLRKESVEDEEKTETLQKVAVSLITSKTIENLTGNVTLLDSSKHQLGTIQEITAVLKKDTTSDNFNQISLDQLNSKELFIMRCHLNHKTLDNSKTSSIGTFDGIRYSYDRVHLDTFYRGFESIYLNNDFVDLKVTVKCENNQFQYEAHKIVLSARSPILLRMISSSDNNSIELDVSSPIYDCFHYIIQYFYTGKIDFNRVSPLSVYRFAYDYEVMDLMWRARKELSGRWLSEKNADLTMTAAVDCEDEFLKDSIEMYMRLRHKKRWNTEMKKFENRSQSNERINENESNVEAGASAGEITSSDDMGSKHLKIQKTIKDYFCPK